MLNESQNGEFWDELCGSGAARALGINDASKDSLGIYDSWYFSFYPYLREIVGPYVSSGDKVLEIGLGYGSLSQWIAERGTSLVGLDIALGPVEALRERFSNSNLKGSAVCGSILSPPLDLGEGVFDTVVAIGSLHHTGDLNLAIRKCHELLKPGGSLVMMVYNAYSYRRIITSPLATLSYLLREAFGYRGVVGGSSENERARYDSDSTGKGAPRTDWVSKKSLFSMLDDFEIVSCQRQNFGLGFPLNLEIRRRILRSKVPLVLGLDLYLVANRPLL